MGQDSPEGDIPETPKSHPALAKSVHFLPPSRGGACDVFGWAYAQFPQERILIDLFNSFHILCGQFRYKIL